MPTAGLRELMVLVALVDHHRRVVNVIERPIDVGTKTMSRIGILWRSEG
jgi:hypothetical protein